MVLFHVCGRNTVVIISSNYRQFLRQNFVYKNNLVRNNRPILSWHECIYHYRYLVDICDSFFIFYFDFWLAITYYSVQVPPYLKNTCYLCRDDENLLKNTWKRAFSMSIFFLNPKSGRNTVVLTVVRPYLLKTM
jgi:hypothetical protein